MISMYLNVQPFVNSPRYGVNQGLSHISSKNLSTEFFSDLTRSNQYLRPSTSCCQLGSTKSTNAFENSMFIALYGTKIHAGGHCVILVIP